MTPNSTTTVFFLDKLGDKPWSTTRGMTGNFHKSRGLSKQPDVDGFHLTKLHVHPCLHIFPTLHVHYHHVDTSCNDSGGDQRPLSNSFATRNTKLRCSRASVSESYLDKSNEYVYITLVQLDVANVPHPTRSKNVTQSHFRDRNPETPKIWLLLRAHARTRVVE